MTVWRGLGGAALLELSDWGQALRFQRPHTVLNSPLSSSCCRSKCERPALLDAVPSWTLNPRNCKFNEMFSVMSFLAMALCHRRRRVIKTVLFSLVQKIPSLFFTQVIFATCSYSPSSLILSPPRWSPSSQMISLLFLYVTHPS